MRYAGGMTPRLSLDDDAGLRAFIVDNTRILAPPLVPEIILHLAEESLPIWRRTEEELGAMNLPPPFWAFAWAGGQALARYVLDHPELVRGRRVLDLGAGSGVAAVAAAHCGAAHVLAADVDAISLVAAEMNAAANGLSIATTADDLLDRPPPPCDVLIIGDLFYERSLAARALAFAETAAASGATVLVGDPRRSYFPLTRFVEVAEYRVPVTRELEDSEIKRTGVWRLAGGTP